MSVDEIGGEDGIRTGVDALFVPRDCEMGPGSVAMLLATGDCTDVIVHAPTVSVVC